ncbi:MAG TPA: hypothetical protein HPP76_06250 [Desulfuromonadales bacterium]|nr:hypothetical protein [Desulfuromonadales bacterium]
MQNSELLIADVKGYCAATVEMLLEVHVYKNVSSKLLIPQYKSDKNNAKRISEQEARFLFAHAIENGKNEYLYSIETPTVGDYSFSGSGERSASTDMSLYKNDYRKDPIVNIEFKSKNPPEAHISKDICKLVIEQTEIKNNIGVWFHLVENADNGTIKSIIKKMQESFYDKDGEYLKKYSAKYNLANNSNITILFCFCVLSEGAYWFEFIHNRGNIDDNFKTVSEIFLKGLPKI